MPDAQQDTIGLSDYQAILLTHIQLVMNQNPQIPFHRALLQLLFSQTIHMPSIVLFQVQNLALALVKLHTVGDCSALYFSDS